MSTYSTVFLACNYNQVSFISVKHEHNNEQRPHWEPGFMQKSALDWGHRLTAFTGTAIVIPGFSGPCRLALETKKW